MFELSNHQFVVVVVAVVVVAAAAAAGADAETGHPGSDQSAPRPEP